MTELSKGDFLYQSDQELFMVVTEVEEDTIKFAAHGWREIDKDRIEEYIEDSGSKVHGQDKVEELITNEGDDETRDKFNKLKQLFSVYEQAELPDDGPQNDFTLDET